MNGSRQRNSTGDFGLEQLATLPTVPAREFADWQSPVDQAGPCCKAKASLFTNDQEYRYCNMIAQNPLQPSSFYPAKAGVSSKTAQPLRRKLIRLGYIREYVVRKNLKGRSSILLEILPAGTAALDSYEKLNSNDGA